MEFNTGGTADSSNSGAMTGGTMASSMYKNGGGVGRFKVGVFNEQQLRNKEDKKAVEKAQRETGLKYVDTKMIKKGGKMYLEVYLIPNEEYYESSKFAKGGGLKPIPKGNKGLPKLPKSVRNKMGYMAKGGGVESEYIVTLQNADNGELLKLNVIGTSKENAVDNAYMEADLNQPYEVYSVKKMAKGGKMEWGGTAESSETGEFIGGENQSSMYARGGHVSKGEMVWKKLKSSDKIQFLYENFTPEITPRSQEILVGKAWNFLPKNVKIKFEAKYANVENYGEGGGTGVSSETGEFIGGENASSMYKKGGSLKGKQKKLGLGGRVSNINDATATSDLKDELRSKMKKGDDVIHFAYTDYGGDFMDKVAIEYFEENYPKNTLSETTAYYGKNAFVFGKPATEWIESTEDYPLGFEDFESYYYEKQNEQENEDFEKFLDDLKRDGYEVSDGAIGWLNENKGGYYSMTTQGLDFSYSDLEDELKEEGLITKDEMAKGGGVGSQFEYTIGGL